MKKLEIIQKIIQEPVKMIGIEDTHDVSNLLQNSKINNLMILCVLNKKYLTKENLNYIFSEEKLMNNITKDKLGSYNYITTLISFYPKLLNKYKILNELIKNISVNNWIMILKKQPQLIDKCNILDNISYIQWNYILFEQPNLSKYCNKFTEFREDNWFDLLIRHPELIDKCDKNLDSKIIIKLIERHPKLIEKININDIDKFDFEKIIYRSDDYHIKALEKYTEKYKDPEVLTNMIGIYPDLKELYTKKDLWKYVDFSKLTDNLEYSILK